MNEHNQAFRILIVDDNPKNIQLLGTILMKEGYEINIAQNGLQALDVVARMPPDLILLDVMMPELDGFETCKRLKADAQTRDTPVIFLTAKVETEDIVQGFELGAVDYVTKPFNPAELLSRVSTNLELKAAREKLKELADQLSKYLSPQVYASIFSGQTEARIESYRRPLTICFTDIVGFTPKAEEMELQDLTEWLNHYLNEMATIALRYDGTLDKFIGDSVMVFFGDPQSQGRQQDAIACVRMAMEMQRRAQELGIPVRIGISSGDCTVGNFGSEDRMEYTIVGQVVNAAARLEQHSEPGRILIGSTTYELVKDEIGCELRGEIHVKGIARDLMTYWVVEASS
ncbi:MAG: response regulator [Amphritea sp.]